MAIDDRTAYLDLPKPHGDNLLSDDVLRLRAALDAIDADIDAKLAATAYSAADVLAKIVTVDGAGSGLDADTLDGAHAADLAASTHAHAAASTAAAGFLSASDKSKLDGIAAGAQVNVVTSVNGQTGAVTVTAGTHTHAIATTETSGFMSATDKSKLDGIAAGADVNIVHSVAGKTGAVTLVAADVGASPSTHSHGAASTAAAGFLSASDKSKLDGIAPGADVNTVLSVAGKTGTIALVASDVGASPSTHSHGAASTSAAGFMTATDKSKLDGIAAGAQVNVVTSVNGYTGAVALTAADVGAVSTASGSGSIKSIQQGTIAMADNATTATASITAVDAGKTILIHNGSSTTTKTARLVLENGTKVSAFSRWDDGAAAATISFTAIEFN